MREIAGLIFPSAASSLRWLRLRLEVTAPARSRSPHSVKMRGNARRQKIPSPKTKARLSRAFAVVDVGSAYFASFAI
jgi:hypothetical protein